jgi:hypothetical protein
LRGGTCGLRAGLLGRIGAGFDPVRSEPAWPALVVVKPSRSRRCCRPARIAAIPTMHLYASLHGPRAS